jgi:hypothetical protein
VALRARESSGPPPLHPCMLWRRTPAQLPPLPATHIPLLPRNPCLAPSLLLPPLRLQWLEDNTPYNAKKSEGRQAERRARELHSWIRNLAIILFDALLQLPSVLCLLWYSNTVRAGNINFESGPTWAGICGSRVAVYFYIYCGSAVVSQGIGFLVSPLRYMRLAACTNVAAVLCVLWALYLPQARACGCSCCLCCLRRCRCWCCCCLCHPLLCCRCCACAAAYVLLAAAHLCTDGTTCRASHALLCFHPHAAPAPCLLPSLFPSHNPAPCRPPALSTWPTAPPRQLGAPSPPSSF